MTSPTPFGRIASVFGGAIAMAAAVGAFVLTDAPTARAQVAAKVESQTRPNFGILLDPPARNARGRASSHRRFDYGRHRPDWRPGYPGGRPGGEEVVLVDCGGNPGTGAVEDAVRRVRARRHPGHPCARRSLRGLAEHRQAPDHYRRGWF